MDVQMPEMDGLEAARQIRADEAASGAARIPILALTAHASQAHHEQCLAHGMDAVVTKPVEVPNLLRQIALVANAGYQTSPLREARAVAI
jgi:CheY-like chemotaxis protein